MSLDLQALTDEEVVFFIRIRGKQSYFANVYTQKFMDQFSGLKTFRTISEYTKDATYHIDLSPQKRVLTKEQWLRYTPHIDFYDVIQRCRALRCISFSEAMELISRAIHYFEGFFSANPQLKLIVMGTVDNYVMDLMERLAALHGVQCLAITDSFMSPKYKLISVRGEANHVSSPSEEEVSAACSEILAKLKSGRSVRLSRMIKRALYGYASYHYRLGVRYLFRHVLQGRHEYEYRFAPLFKGCNSLRKFLAVFYLDKDIKRNDGSKPIAYVPLHYVPEATIDYWVNDSYDCDYERSLQSVVEELTRNGFQVVVKEHPAFQFSRELEFYKSLKKIGATLLSGTVPTNKVFDAADIVVVWNGSTGIEAALYGKPVVRVSNSYYGDAITTFETFIKSKDVDPLDGRELVKRALECSFQCN